MEGRDADRDADRPEGPSPYPALPRTGWAPCTSGRTVVATSRSRPTETIPARSALQGKIW